MKSRTSFFNRGFARDLWRRTWPLWAGYLLILLLFGPMNMLNQLQYPAYNYVSGKANFNYSLASGGELLLWLSLGMGCLAVMAVFSFLYNSRGCGMVNSFPMSRTETFWTCYLTGLLPLLAADLLTAGLTALFCPGGYLDGSTVLALLGVAVFSNVFFYSFASFCAMLTGSLLVLPLAYALLNFAAVVAEVTVQEVLSYVVYGLGSFTTVQLGFLSPLVGMLKRYRVGYVNWPTEIAIEGLGALALYALAGFAFALLAWALYRRRQMETSGDSVAIPALKPIFQVCMCFGAAFVFAEVIYSLPNIVWRGRQAALVVLGLLLVGAFLGWFAARMIIEKSLRVFRGHWGGFLICAAMLIVLVGACEFDLFGYERRVPDANEVESVKLYGDTLREPENIAAAVAFHRGLIENRAYHEAEPTIGVESHSTEGEVWTTTRGVLLVYQLKNGRTLERWYSVRGNSETAQDPESDLRRFYALRNAQEAILERCSLPFELTAERIQWANLQIYNPEELRPGTDTLLDSITLSREEMVDFWENGILPDAAEGHIARERLVVGDADWDYTNTEVYLMAVEDPQRFERMGGNSEAMYHRVFRIASDSVHSLDWIEAHTGVRPVVMEDNSLVLGGVG